ncbi:uncharacterized protein MCYG_06990 [Microsporum canis CBS 113480]|uniref:Uncharacterized protein n=1 Tax=Arthroderma otae (strain ATCC MYA-4605 / CBS 113480) TaxID=554155 RepID=C5FW87_ARTOC|nr:uncharacterized protein MCYG_06990 [Microsporum canis CBS 113480]EEQ34171.1 predicted protein [Microsporum canis CBS 113480]
MLTQQAWDVAMRRRFNFRFTSSKRPFVSPHPLPVEDESRYYNFDDTLAPIRPGSPLTSRRELDPATLVHLRHACISLYHKTKSQGQAGRRAPIPQSDPVYFKREYERRRLAALPPGRRPMGSTEESKALETAASRPDARARPSVVTDLPSSTLSPTSAVAPDSAGVVTDQPSSTEMEIRRTISAPPHTETEGAMAEDPSSFPYRSENRQVPSVNQPTVASSPVHSIETQPAGAAPPSPHTAGRQGSRDIGTETQTPTGADTRQHAESTPRPISQGLGLVPVATRASAQGTLSTTTTDSIVTDTTTTTTVTAASTSTDVADLSPPITAPSAGQLSRVQTFVKKLSKFGFHKKKASNRSNVGLGMVVEAT